MELWHNPRCSKSRAAKQALDDSGRPYVERRYLDQPPTAAELDEVLETLGMQPWELARTGDPLAKELDLGALPHDRQKWIDVLVANPSLIQRPIVIAGDGRASVARTPQAVSDILG
ncbi:arsenate reductase family protein [Labedaea rhizosphaerae]|uniref:Arsenate reductase n=1 Tax=Labedaea rhizosphaerae TaxID=598644 RepID=A0A4R6S2R1_LABRH|nr:arsenate reductase family protein [Labedaea rhizosphaerae]TDP93862.1 arsenate reductase [Labedaea rhizosphaerae]